MATLAFAGDDDPWNDPTLGDPSTTAPAPEPVPPPDAVPAVAPAPVPEAPVAKARRPTDVPLAGGHVPEGHRVVAIGGGSGVSVEQQFVVGSAGGTDETLFRAHYGQKRFSVTAGVPFAAYRTPDGRSAALGNIQLAGYYIDASGHWQVGLETHFHLGDPAWTWSNEADDLWPGGGVDVVWEGEKVTGATTLMIRGAAGLHHAAPYAPYPSSGTYFRVQAAGVIDHGFGDRFGVVGEASIAYWDPSPVEITGLFRADIIPGLRARAGFVLPLFVWFGATPSDQRAGLSETTAVIDLSMNL